MNPKEKAEQIVNELFERTLAYHDACIAAKLLAEEMVNELNHHNDTHGFWQDDNERQSVIGRLVYWQEVKKEIEKL